MAVVDTDQTDPQQDDVTSTVAQNPSIALVKTGTLNDDDGTTGVSEGDTITYAFDVTNDGNVTLYDVTLTDAIPGVTILGGPISSLAPGAVDSTTFTGSYTVRQSDIDAGSFTNTATVTGITPNQTEVSDTDDHEQDLSQNPEYTITKTASLADNGQTANEAGDVINYTIVVENTGNQSLTGVDVTDNFISNLSVPTESITTDNILQVGETWTYTGSYQVTREDIDSNGNGDGLIENVASVVSTQIQQPQTDDASIEIDQAPDYTVTKTANVTEVDAAATSSTTPLWLKTPVTRA
ncbi:MAG: hypothetical protein R2873_03020 [Caldilineaceae bacterium]